MQRFIRKIRSLLGLTSGPDVSSLSNEIRERALNEARFLHSHGIDIRALDVGEEVGMPRPAHPESSSRESLFPNP